MRIGIDVGGTNTDGVLMDGHQVIAKVKTPTTADVTSGVLNAFRALLDGGAVVSDRIHAVMIGTTHFVNAVLERRHLSSTAAVRLCLPSGQALPPMVDWPEDLRSTIGNHWFMVHGGREFDGRRISALDPSELRGVAEEIGRRGIETVAITGVFSPITGEDELEAAEVIRSVLPEADISLSHQVGRMGLLERENATIMNACLRALARKTVGAFRQAMAGMGITAPLYLTQNDGTLMSADYAEQYPVLSFGSGPTNSMRGAAFLSGLKDAMVVDIGGTSTDVGALHHGFPREASVAVRVGGVRTNFRMPDVYSIALGGGTKIETDPVTIGPVSVGYEITRRALVFGGSELVSTDIAVAAGVADLGDQSKVAHLPKELVGDILERMQVMVEDAIDRMKLAAGDVPVILVGGGSLLLARKLKGASEVLKPEHFEAANAVGAAIAQISGEVDRVFSLEGTTRDAAIQAAKDEAAAKAVAAGADPTSVQIVEVEDIPLAYLPSSAIRIRVKAVGDLLETVPQGVS